MFLSNSVDMMKNLYKGQTISSIYSGLTFGESSPQISHRNSNNSYRVEIIIRYFFVLNFAEGTMKNSIGILVSFAKSEKVRKTISCFPHILYLYSACIIHLHTLIYLTRSNSLAILDYEKPIYLQYNHPQPPPRPLISCGH